MFGDSKNILIVSPHLDDAFLSLGGTLCKIVKEKKKVFDLVVFSFDPFNILRITNKQESVAMRIKEEKKNCNKLGIKFVKLGYKAAYKERGYRHWQSLINVKRDRDIIKSIQADVEKI